MRVKNGQFVHCVAYRGMVAIGEAGTGPNSKCEKKSGKTRLHLGLSFGPCTRTIPQNQSGLNLQKKRPAALGETAGLRYVPTVMAAGTGGNLIFWDAADQFSSARIC